MAWNAAREFDHRGRPAEHALGHLIDGARLIVC
jgi:hypothetical protein